MFFGKGKLLLKELFVNISSPVPSINNVQSLREALTLGRMVVKWLKTGKSIVMQIRKWSISIENTSLYFLISKSLHCFDFPTSYYLEIIC